MKHWTAQVTFLDLPASKAHHTVRIKAGKPWVAAYRALTDLYFNGQTQFLLKRKQIRHIVIRLQVT